MSDKIVLKHTSLKKDFIEHLKLINNKRILLSGPFGTGKSTFLEEISDEHGSNFIFIKLYPINYSVSPTEDVFELIKYDLLCELIGRYKSELDLQKEDFSMLLSSQVFILERMKYLPIINSIIALSEKIGKPATEIIKALSETIEDFNKFKKGIELDEEADIKNYLNEIEREKGSSYEMDNISQLISNLLIRVKNKRRKDEKERFQDSVLIVDDLDRLDPEHAFRLFNIFSAQYDPITDRNKFGFDKIIFVCDVRNIRSLFHHKYGRDVDFNGYIDKFFSQQIYDFDNRKYIQEKIADIISELPIRLNESNHHVRVLQTTTSEFYLAFEWIVISLLESRVLNLRALINYPILSPPNYTFFAGERQRKYFASNYEIITLFYLFRNFYTSNEDVIEKIAKMEEMYNENAFHIISQSTSNEEHAVRDIIISYCLTLLLPDTKGLNRASAIHSPNTQFFNLPEFGVKIGYNFNNGRNTFPYFESMISNDSFASPIDRINLYKLLRITFETGINSGYIK